jgi:transposase
VQDFLQQQQIDQLPWPANSPDGNPIEHAWDALDRAVRSRDVQPSNLDELATALQEEWRNIGQWRINKLVESMPRRIQAVIDSRGGYTKYWWLFAILLYQ